MKTAMQELLGLVEQMFNNAKTIEIESSMNDVINIIAQEGLPKEKEQMVDFARNIIIDATCSVEGYVTTEKDIEEYYNETFNTNEK
jgi:hypothetical protein